MQRAYVLFLYYHLLDTVLRKIDLNTAEEGACLNWHGAIDVGTPVMAMPHRRMGRCNDPTLKPPQQIRVRALMLELFSNKRPPTKAKTPRSIVVSNTCLNQECICPDCSRYVRRGIPIAMGLANMDLATSTLRRKRIAETKQSIRVLTPEQVQRIKFELSTTARELARQMNVNFSVVHSCRSGRTYQDFRPSPFAGLGG